MYNVPILGWDELDPAIAWRDRTVIAAVPGGVLGDPSQWAEEKAEREACAREIEYKEQLRHQGVAILDDYRKEDTYGESEIW
jgi:hypothetical protein